MQLTVDIPEPIYRDLEEQAQRESKSVADLVVERAAGPLSSASLHSRAGRGQVHLPLIPGEPGSMMIPDEGLNKFMFSTNHEPA